MPENIIDEGLMIRTLFKDLNKLVNENLSNILSMRYDIKIKPDGSPVTKADIYLENLIFQYLKTELGDVFLIGEESYNEKMIESPEEGYYAILDPIDGTENFCSGLKEWGISLSIWRSGKHLGSVLMMPEMHDIIMSGDSITPVRSRIRGYSSTPSKIIYSSLETNTENRIIGCSVYNLMNVIRGSFYRFTNPCGAHSWDIIAGLQIALENNCDVLIDGESYDGRLLTADKKYRIDIHNRHDLHPG